MNLYEDKVADFLDQCYSAGIKDPVRFLTDKMPRVYGWLKGAFPRGILPTDIDGEVEINGKFLRLEFKHESALREGRIPKGQLMCFERLLKTEAFTVFVVGHDQSGVITCAHIWGRKGKKVIDPCGPEELKELCKRWADSTSKTNN